MSVEANGIDRTEPRAELGDDYGIPVLERNGVALC